jgi:capsular polysaccharide biosynthesis protein
VFVTLACVSVFIVARLERQYVAGANVLVVNGNTREDPTLSSPDLPSIATSTVVLDRVVSDLRLDVTTLAIKKHLTIKPPAFKSSIMRIEYTDSNSDRAAVVANGVADELTRYYSEISIARYDADLTALNRELVRESNRINAISAEMQARGGSAPPSLDAKGNDPESGRLATLETDLALSKASLQGDSAGVAALAPGSDEDSKTYRRDVLSDDRNYLGLQSAIAATELTLETDHALYTKRYPGFPALQHKIQSLRNALRSEARRALSSPDAYSPTLAQDAAQRRKAEALVVADQARVGALSDLVVAEQARQAAQAPLESLRLHREAAQTEFLSISARRATALADRADALSLGSVVVVDRAIASEVKIGLGPRTLGIVLLFLSLCVALGCAFVADMFDPHLNRIVEIEKLYRHPVIMTIGDV